MTSVFGRLLTSSKKSSHKKAPSNGQNITEEKTEANPVNKKVTIHFPTAMSQPKSNLKTTSSFGLATPSKQDPPKPLPATLDEAWDQLKEEMTDYLSQYHLMVHAKWAKPVNDESLVKWCREARDYLHEIHQVESKRQTGTEKNQTKVQILASILKKVSFANTVVSGISDSQQTRDRIVQLQRKSESLASQNTRLRQQTKSQSEQLALLQSKIESYQKRQNDIKQAHQQMLQQISSRPSTQRVKENLELLLKQIETGQAILLPPASLTDEPQKPAPGPAPRPASTYSVPHFSAPMGVSLAEHRNLKTEYETVQRKFSEVQTELQTQMAIVKQLESILNVGNDPQNMQIKLKGLENSQTFMNEYRTQFQVTEVNTTLHLTNLHKEVQDMKQELQNNAQELPGLRKLLLELEAELSVQGHTNILTKVQGIKKQLEKIKSEIHNLTNSSKKHQTLINELSTIFHLPVDANFTEIIKQHLANETHLKNLIKTVTGTDDANDLTTFKTQFEINNKWLSDMAASLGVEYQQVHQQIQDHLANEKILIESAKKMNDQLRKVNEEKGDIETQVAKLRAELSKTQPIISQLIEYGPFEQLPEQFRKVINKNASDQKSITELKNQVHTLQTQLEGNTKIMIELSTALNVTESSALPKAVKALMNDRDAFHNLFLVFQQFFPSITQDKIQTLRTLELDRESWQSIASSVNKMIADAGAAYDQSATPGYLCLIILEELKKCTADQTQIAVLNTCIDSLKILSDQVYMIGYWYEAFSEYMPIAGVASAPDYFTKLLAILTPYANGELFRYISEAPANLMGLVPDAAHNMVNTLLLKVHQQESSATMQAYLDQLFQEWGSMTQGIFRTGHIEPPEDVTSEFLNSWDKMKNNIHTIVTSDASIDKKNHELSQLTQQFKDWYGAQILFIKHRNQEALETFRKNILASTLASTQTSQTLQEQIEKHLKTIAELQSAKTEVLKNAENEKQTLRIRIEEIQRQLAEQTKLKKKKSTLKKQDISEDVDMDQEDNQLFSELKKERDQLLSQNTGLQNNIAQFEIQIAEKTQAHTWLAEQLQQQGACNDALCRKLSEDAENVEEYQPLIQSMVDSLGLNLPTSMMHSISLFLLYVLTQTGLKPHEFVCSSNPYSHEAPAFFPVELKQRYTSLESNIRKVDLFDPSHQSALLLDAMRLVLDAGSDQPIITAITHIANSADEMVQFIEELNRFATASFEKPNLINVREECGEYFAKIYLLFQTYHLVFSNIWQRLGDIVMPDLTTKSDVQSRLDRLQVALDQIRKELDSKWNECIATQHVYGILATRPHGVVNTLFYSPAKMLQTIQNPRFAHPDTEQMFKQDLKLVTKEWLLFQTEIKLIELEKIYRPTPKLDQFIGDYLIHRFLVKWANYQTIDQISTWAQHVFNLRNKRVGSKEQQFQAKFLNTLSSLGAVTPWQHSSLGFPVKKESTDVRHSAVLQVVGEYFINKNTLSTFGFQLLQQRTELQGMQMLIKRQLPTQNWFEFQIFFPSGADDIPQIVETIVSCLNIELLRAEFAKFGAAIIDSEHWTQKIRQGTQYVETTIPKVSPWHVTFHGNVLFQDSPMSVCPSILQFYDNFTQHILDLDVVLDLNGQLECPAIRIILTPDNALGQYQKAVLFPHTNASAEHNHAVSLSDTMLIEDAFMNFRHRASSVPTRFPHHLWTSVNNTPKSTNPIFSLDPHMSCLQEMFTEGWLPYYPHRISQ